MDSFKTIQKNISGQIVEKKSKFIANLFYIETSKQAEEIIKQTKKKYHDARHNCYAYIVLDSKQDITQRCSDDGEPSGTAGVPMLNILKGNNLCNILVIVTRYFGGILLGTGGLLRAYSESLLTTLEKADYIIKEKGQIIKITIGYEEIENIKYYCRKNSINIVKEEYQNNVEFFIEISNEMLEKVKENIDKKYINTIKIDKIEEKYIKRNTEVSMNTKEI